MLRGLCLCGVILASVLQVACGGVHAQDCADLMSGHPQFEWTGLQPAVLFTEYNPWAMAIGSDMPTFALYKDGTVIYWQGDHSKGKYVSAHLSSSQMGDLLKAARLDELQEVGARYCLEDVTDLPTNVLTVSGPQGYKTIEVYGVIRDLAQSTQTGLPVQLDTAFRTLLAFRATDAQDWRPPYFEVIVWPFTYAKSSADWPAEFPGLADKNTKKTRDGYLLFLPIGKLDQYRKFAAGLTSKEAVKINGEKWTMSARFPFPHEGAPTGQ